MIKTFEDYKKEHLGLDADGLVACRHEGIGGTVMKVPEYSDFEQIWDFWTERTEKKQMLIDELSDKLYDPIEMLLEQVGDQTHDEDAVELGNNLNRIKRILLALKG